jgi:hypothetical protein
MMRSLLIGFFTAAALQSDGLIAQQRSESFSPPTNANGVATVTPVVGRRAILRNPNPAAVLPFGRRGLLGLRPQGYVIIGRAPATVYRRDLAVPPPAGFGYRLDDAPLPPLAPSIAGRPSGMDYDLWPAQASFEDDQWLDQTHRQIERSLRPSSDANRNDVVRSYAPGPIVETGEPEELPLPAQPGATPANRATSATAGQARDIARPRESGDLDRQPSQAQVPPPPQPDPPNQPTSTLGGNSSVTRPAPVSAPDAKAQPQNSGGPLLQDPNTGAGEF